MSGLLITVCGVFLDGYSCIDATRHLEPNEVCADIDLGEMTEFIWDAYIEEGFLGITLVRVECKDKET